MGTYKTVLMDVREHIGFITLNRPKEMNTFTDSMARDLNDALLELDALDDVRVVVVRGSGRAFCAGIDVKGLRNKTPKEYYDWITAMEQVHLVMGRMKKPVIASVHGVAVANGIGVVASADLAVVSEDARFGATAVKVGLFCTGPAVPLTRCLGRKKALELVLTGDIIDAKEAERIGLVNQVVPRDQLEKATMDMAKKIASYSPLGVQCGKQSFYQSADLEFDKALEIANQNFALICTTKDAQEGISAFLEKKEPHWNLK